MQEPSRAHLIHECEHFGVAVDDDCDRENEAGKGVEDEVAVVAPRSVLPGQGAGGLDPLEPVGAPTQQRSPGPEQAEDPDGGQADDAPPHAQVQAVSRLTHHVVALVGEQSQSTERHQTWERKM